VAYTPELNLNEVVHSPASTANMQVAKSPFKIESVVVCDRYHDFLAQVLPHNKVLFNKMVVVTSWEDKNTQSVCEYYHVECVRTDGLESRKGKFCKGVGINDGLAKLDMDGWVVHMDSDICLPPQTRILLEQANLDAAMIYGIDRFIVKGYEAWDDFRAMPRLQHEANAYIHMSAFPMGTRVMQDVDGYIPIGFFQMWNPQVSGISNYPAEHTNAGRGDMLHSKRWPRALRGFIPEIIAYHLESDDSAMSSNWNGRVTAPFASK
jgi:hypothetical protein